MHNISDSGKYWNTSGCRGKFPTWGDLNNWLYQLGCKRSKKMLTGKPIKFSKLSLEWWFHQTGQVQDLEQASKVKNPMKLMSACSKVKLNSGSWGRESTWGWPLHSIINVELWRIMLGPEWSILLGCKSIQCEDDFMKIYSLLESMNPMSEYERHVGSFALTARHQTWFFWHFLRPVLIL